MSSISSSRLSPSLQSAISAFIDQHKLPADYIDTVEQWFIPLAEDILRQLALHEGTFVLGINGTQGSGKSTLAALLVLLLREMQGLRCIDLSIDDFYLTRAERAELAATVHPLLMTRGVPGTHDIDLALETLTALQQPGTVAIPRFDKAIDDRSSPDQWPTVTAPVDVIILEGWCVGLEPQTEAELQQAVNELEKQEDTHSLWRRYVNEQLGGNYQSLFGQIDMLVMLKAPAFENVLAWRRRQEEKLAARSRQNTGTHIMSEEELVRFISHYERLTKHALKTLPNKADMVFQLDSRQVIQDKTGLS